jgi:GNAT superfamily N-acetyltransferase
MLTILPPSHNIAAQPLFSGLDEHLVLGSIFAGNTPAAVYVDDPVQPCAAFTIFKHHALLGGAPQTAFVSALGQVMNDQIIPTCKASRIDGFVLAFDHPAWQDALPELFPGQTPIQARRQYYAHALTGATPTPEEDLALPSGFDALPVDAALLSRTDLLHIDELRDETCSERISVEDFIARSFGMCLVHGNELAAWCLSEYNCDGRCEVGVATHENFQRRGLGTRVTRLLLDQARARGMRQVGWHCWSRNLPSGALARRAGFDLIKEFDTYIYPL